MHYCFLYITCEGLHARTGANIPDPQTAIRRPCYQLRPPIDERQARHSPLMPPQGHRADAVGSQAVQMCAVVQARRCQDP